MTQTLKKTNQITQPAAKAGIEFSETLDRQQLAAHESSLRPSNDIFIKINQIIKVHSTNRALTHTAKTRAP